MGKINTENAQNKIYLRWSTVQKETSRKTKEKKEGQSGRKYATKKFLT